jgi:pimeloyl-ACP methyl ester carboxylesterase
MHGYDHEVVGRACFRPGGGATLEYTDTARPVDVVLPRGGTLGGYWSGPLPLAPVLLVLPSGEQVVSEMLDLWPTLARDAGANLFLIDYPGFGGSPGRPTLSGCVEAASSALRYLLERPLEEVPAVVVLGRGIGATFALQAARASRARRIRGLVLESGQDDLAEWLRPRARWDDAGLDPEPVLAEVARDFDARAALGELRLPTLVFQPTVASPTPISAGERLAQWSGGELVFLEHGDRDQAPHLNLPEYRRQLRAFVLASTAGAADEVEERL